MTYKIIDIREKHTMTKKQEKAVEIAFERFEGRTNLNVPKREHLGSEFDPTFSCDHAWSQVDSHSDGAKEFLQKTFEETELGDYAMKCTKCGALSLWENGKIFAFDAVNVVVEAQQERPQRPQKKHQKRVATAA